MVDDYEDYLTDPDYASGARRVKYVHIGKNALFNNNSVELLGSGGNGGAIEVQSGELSIDDGATFTGNSSKSTGGAIAVCDWSQGGIGIRGVHSKQRGKLWRSDHQRRRRALQRSCLVC